jgi:uncharacterized protein YsxB (DUF464 family)
VGYSDRGVSLCYKPREQCGICLLLPLDPQYVISVCDGKVQEWNINGHNIAPGYDGYCAAFSLDGTMFVFAMRGLFRFKALILEQLYLNSILKTLESDPAVFPLMEGFLHLLVLMLPMCMTLPTQNFAPLSPSLAIMAVSLPLYFPPPPPSFQHPQMDQ